MLPLNWELGNLEPAEIGNLVTWNQQKQPAEAEKAPAESTSRKQKATHIWQLDEQRNALEAHVVLVNRERMDEVKTMTKSVLLERFQISHSTLEFECKDCGARC